MNDNQRIEQLKNYLNLSANALSKELKLPSPQIFYDIKAGKCGISKDLAAKIKEYCLNVNLSWLLTGEGEMLKTETHSNKSDALSIPVLPIAAQGGSLNDFSMSIMASECEQMTSPIKGADMAMVVAGDSMAPEYPSGSQVLIKKINERAFIDWGKVYVLDTCNGSVIKRILPAEDPNKVQCVSINPEYPPFEVSFCDMYGMYRVLLCMSIK